MFPNEVEEETSLPEGLLANAKECSVIQGNGIRGKYGHQKWQIVDKHNRLCFSTQVL